MKKKENIFKRFSGIISYGSAIGLGMLLGWKVGVLMLLFIAGHNLEHHVEKYYK